MESHWLPFDYGHFGAKGVAILSQKVPLFGAIGSKFGTQRLHNSEPEAPPFCSIGSEIWFQIL